MCSCKGEPVVAKQNLICKLILGGKFDTEDEEKKDKKSGKKQKEELNTFEYRSNLVYEIKLVDKTVTDTTPDFINKMKLGDIEQIMAIIERVKDYKNDNP